ncbi:MAG: response regulator [Bacteroidetes bacterium]|nr:response regulator [Bacteroidota bacterium]
MSKVDTICLVDDDEVYHYIMERTISRNKLAKTILKFMDGETAINFFNQNLANQSKLPELILLDLNMPVMDGWEFLQEFLIIQPQLKKKVTIYLVTSSVNETDIEKAQNFQIISGYLVKPIAEEKLLEILDNIPKSFTVS